MIEVLARSIAGLDFSYRRGGIESPPLKAFGLSGAMTLKLSAHSAYVPASGMKARRRSIGL